MAVYIVCLDEPLVAFTGRRWKTSWHYTGRTEKRGVDASVEKRLEEHRKGRSAGGSAFLDECNLRGIHYDVVRVYEKDDPYRKRRDDGSIEGDAELERRLKRQGSAAKHCPRCHDEFYATRRKIAAAKRNGTYVKPERPPDLDALEVLEEFERQMEREYEEIPF